MSAIIQNRKEPTAGTITIKGAYYYLVMTWNETIKTENKTTVKKKTKWIPTKIATKESGSKKKAKDLLLTVRLVFDKNNPNTSLNELLTMDADIQNNVKILEPTTYKEPIIEPVVDKGILFSEYLVEWLADVKYRIELTTYAGYQGNVLNKIVPYFKEKRIYLSDITAQDIHMFYKYMIRTGLKTETVIRYHSNIRKALVDAVSMNSIYKINANILLELKKPFKPEKEIFIPSFYSVDETNEMFRVFKEHRIELLVRLTAFYGFRREEVLGLKWSAINFNQNTISVSHTVTQCSVDGISIMVYKDRGKNTSSRRTLPLVDELRKTLLEHKEKIEENKKLFGREYINTYYEYICVDDIGDLIKPGYITKNFVKTLDLNGLRRIRFHDLRHSCASLLLACGVPMKLIQEWLGHSNYSTTADRYSHLEHSQKIESANALANIGLNMK